MMSPNHSASASCSVVDVGHEVEGLFLQLDQVAGLGDARVADQDIQAAELLHGLLHHLRHALLVGHVDLHGGGVGAQLVGDGLGAGQVHVRDHDGRAFAVHLLGDALAEALGRAGDDGDLARQAALGFRALGDVFLGYSLPLAHIDHWNHPLSVF